MLTMSACLVVLLPDASIQDCVDTGRSGALLLCASACQRLQLSAQITPGVTVSLAIGTMMGTNLMLQGFNKSDATEVDIAVQECCDIIQAIMTIGIEKALSGVRV